MTPTPAEVARILKSELVNTFPHHTFSVRSYRRDHQDVAAIFCFYWPDPDAIIRDRVQAIMDEHTNLYPHVVSAGAGYYAAKPRELGGTAEYEPTAGDDRRAREALDRMWDTP